MEDRRKFVTKMNNSKKQKQKVGENLLLILEKLDNMEKPRILGNAFKAYIEEKIDDIDFVKISSIINRINIDDLYALKDVKNQEIAQNLATNGLMTFNVKGESVSHNNIGAVPIVNTELFYRPNRIANVVLNLGILD